MKIDKKIALITSGLIILIVLFIVILIVQIMKSAKEADENRPSFVASETVSEQISSVASEKPVSSEERNTLEDEWMLILVSKDSPLPEDYTCDIVTKDKISLDARVMPHMLEMLEDADAAGMDLLVCSSYRTPKYQQELLDNKIKRLKNEGLSDAAAYAEAITVVTEPNKSEHNSGLAVDIVSHEYQGLDAGFENTKEGKWLKENAYKYGFIERYPSGKEYITGIIYEPWHYRYVGEYAEDIHKSGLCLEEWLAQNKR